MALVLFLCFVVLPFVELAVIVQVAGEIGWPWTLGAMVVSGVVGAWLCKREGLGILRRANDALRSGRVPTDELIEGALVLFAGALMLTPGFVTDLVGILLLVPFTRALVRRALARRFRSRLTSGRRAGVTFVTMGARAAGATWRSEGARLDDEVIDSESWEAEPDRERFGRLPEGP